MNTRIKVGGNIISELSEKIPTNIIALNELIKNSYDAGATTVTIELNTSKKSFCIKDDGCGMNRDDIDTLFHISKSNKIHGKKNDYGRITQGSKGLGFLSVFKFGKKVEWKTNKKNGFRFSVDFDQLIGSDDISKFEIELIEDNNISKGTEILIEIDDYNNKSLIEYFSSEKNYKKIIHSFYDKQFIINLIINERAYSNKKLIPLLNNEKDSQLFYITYNNDTQKIIFKYNNYIVLTEPYKFYIKEFTLNIELLTFQFKPYRKENIDKLFFNPIGDLTPLIYYNNNLFNNYNIFDPNIMRNIKTSQVLNQMIGYIRITSENPLIDFNSDRTQFLQNELTDSLVDFLSNINKKIQEIGSANKFHLVGFDILKEKNVSFDYINTNNQEKYKDLVKDDFAFKNKVKIIVQKDKILFSLFGKTVALPIISNKEASGTTDPKHKEEIIPARIVLNCNNELDIDVPSDQIDLIKFIDSVYNSNGELIDKDQLVIKINSRKLETSILHAIIRPCEKIIDYTYSDPVTGIVLERLKLVFKKPVASITTNKSLSLFTIPAPSNYVIDFNQYLNKLIEQINKLQVNKNLEIISSSLRVLFELSIDGINKSKKFTSIFDGINELDNRVVKIISYIKSNKFLISEISNKTKIEFNSLKNFLSIDDYKRVIEKSHLGAHKSTMYITETDIHDIIKYLSIFIILTNEMINNPNIT